MSKKDVKTGASYSQDGAEHEFQLRRILAGGDPLMAGTERLNVGTGSVSIELLDTRALGSNTYELTVKETAEYPYVDDPSGATMGESYERRVVLEDTSTGWKILENEVPAGNWPLIEGATDFESSNPNSLGMAGDDASAKEVTPIDPNSTRLTNGRTHGP